MNRKENKDYARIVIPIVCKYWHYAFILLHDSPMKITLVNL